MILSLCVTADVTNKTINRLTLSIDAKILVGTGTYLLKLNLPSMYLYR